MATMRTPEEKKRILKKCLEIENEGGNVLAYLVSEDYMSPSGTWYRMQKEMLGRKHPKSGRPKKNGETKEQMQDRLRREQIRKIVQAAEEGKSIRNALHNMGYREPNYQDQKYSFLREYAEKWEPELYAKMPEKLPAPGTGPKRKAG